MTRGEGKEWRESDRKKKGFQRVKPFGGFQGKALTSRMPFPKKILAPRDKTGE